MNKKDCCERKFWEKKDKKEFVEKETHNPFQFPSTKIQGAQFGLDLEMFLRAG